MGLCPAGSSTTPLIVVVAPPEQVGTRHARPHDASGCSPRLGGGGGPVSGASNAARELPQPSTMPTHASAPTIAVAISALSIFRPMDISGGMFRRVRSV